MTLRLQEVPEGYLVLREGGDKLAIVTTRTHLLPGPDGKHKRALTPDEHVALTSVARPVIWDPMPREDWTVHLTTPVLSAVELEELAALLPES